MPTAAVTARTAAISMTRRWAIPNRSCPGYALGRRARRLDLPGARLRGARLDADQLGVEGLRQGLLMIAYEQQGALMEAEMHSAIISIIGGMPQVGRTSVSPISARPS